MKWHEFVFTTKAPQRHLRHVIFWLCWWLYFLATKYLLPQPTARPRVPDSLKLAERPPAQYLTPNSIDLVQSLLVLTAQMAVCYLFIYFLLPRYFSRKRYLLFLAATILISLALVASSHWIVSIVVPYIETNFLDTVSTRKANYWTSISLGGINAIKIFAAASAIKLAKQWWIKQKEKERLEREKVETELQLLKAQIHPSFLFSALNNIYYYSLTASPKAPEMLLKLSDILSYMLYDCSEPRVALEKEIRMLKDYMALERIRFGDRLEMNIQVKGEPAREEIAPLLLLNFVENSFRQCSNNMTEQPWINLELHIREHHLHMKLLNGKPADMTLATLEEDSSMTQAKKRLLLIYPGRHDLKIMEEPEILMVILQIQLSAEVQEESKPMENSRWDTHRLLAEI